MKLTIIALLPLTDAFVNVKIWNGCATASRIPVISIRRDKKINTPSFDKHLQDDYRRQQPRFRIVSPRSFMRMLRRKAHKESGIVGFKSRTVTNKIVTTLKEDSNRKLAATGLSDFTTTFCMNLLAVTHPIFDSTIVEEVRVALFSVLTNITEDQLLITPTNSTSLVPDVNELTISSSHEQEPGPKLDVESTVMWTGGFILRNAVLPAAIHQLVTITVGVLTSHKVG